jgi:hypothetical protein
LLQKWETVQLKKKKSRIKVNQMKTDRISEKLSFVILSSLIYGNSVKKFIKKPRLTHCNSAN